MRALIVFAILSICLAALPDARPAASKRTFTSTYVDTLIDSIRPHFADSDVGTLFYNCFPNTLDTTVSYFGSSKDGNIDSFIITGDIDAMWLRDSTNQVIPYLPYASKDPHLADLITGVINRQARSVLIDPYANSFNFNASGQGHQSDKRTPPMTRAVFEGKYEIDSLCAFLKISYWHWRYTGASVLPTLSTDTWLSAAALLLDTVEAMQKEDGTGHTVPYTFQRMTTEALDTLMMGGRGPPGHECGLTRSLFRPSDDAVTLPYNIPGNAMACVELSHLQLILEAISSASPDLKDRVTALASRTTTIKDAICNSLSSLASRAADAVLPYEVDGGDGAYYMDDANIPSLLSLPILGYVDPSNSVYQATRKYVLSEANPFWFSGAEGEGIGGPHVGMYYAWPMGIIVRAMTSTDDEEIARCLELLVRSSAGTGFMHESFNVDNVNNFTRTWFAWANGLFGELILQLIKDKPHLVLNGTADEIKAIQDSVAIPVSLQAQKEPIVSK